MPLHDWTDRSGWEGMHVFWMTEIARSLRSLLPPGHRAAIGASPLVAIGVTPVRPDFVVTNGTPHPPRPTTGTTSTARGPDLEVAVATLEEDTTVLVEREGRLVAAVELISLRNKDRPTAREQYASRYLNYLRGGIHLLLIDVHRRPLGFSFHQLIAENLGQTFPIQPAPTAVAYRVGAPAAEGGRMLAIWQQSLIVDLALPPMPLYLNLDDQVTIELEETYSRAAADSYVT